MKSSHANPAVPVIATLVILSAGTAQAALMISSGLGTTHAGNLVVNGSFELGAPPDGIANALFWGDAANSPHGVPPAWTGSGSGDAAIWGNDTGPGPNYTLRFSDVLPDGRAAVDFMTATGVTVDQPPTFNANGTVTFPATPNFTSIAGAPVIIHQLVHTEAVVQPSYNLSFWVSGEENSTNQGNIGDGLIGLRMTNVLAGNPIQWLAVPNSIHYGMSKLYEFQFTPLNPSLPVDIAFINWGGMNLVPWGGSFFGVQPILDDVIVNGVPEPSTWSLLLVGAALLYSICWRRRKSWLAENC